MGVYEFVQQLIQKLFRVVVNYADYGLQFFTGDGTFYIELSIGVSQILKS